jgi:hypothetical protein
MWAIYLNCNFVCFLKPSHLWQNYMIFKFVYAYRLCADPVAALSRAWACGRSLAGIAGSNPTGDMEVFLLWVLCVVRSRSPRRADHSSSEALPCVVCPMSVFANPRKGRPSPEIGPKRHRKKYRLYNFFDILAAVYMSWLTWCVQWG